MVGDQPDLPRNQEVDEEELPEAKDPDELPDLEEMSGVEKIGENRYVIRTGDEPDT